MTIPNQAPDSSVAGALQGTPEDYVPGQITGDPLYDYLQQFFAAVSKMDGTRFFQTYQLPDPPNLPPVGVDWAAFTLNESRRIGLYNAVVHHGEGDGVDELQRHEEMEFRVSFYGPNSVGYATNLRDGLSIWQNFSMLRLAGMALVETSDVRSFGDLVHQQWVGRADMTVTIRRFTQRFYKVLNLLSAQAEVQTDSESQYKVEVKVYPPTP